MADPQDVSKLSDQQLLALLNAQPPAAQQSPPDVGYGPGVRPPDAASGNGAVTAWVGDDRMPDPAAAPTPPTQQPAQPPAAPAQQAQPPSNGAPSAVDGGLGQAIDDRARAFASGVPVLGAFADEADAATAAALAPYLEPLARNAPHALQAMLGYDPKKEIGDLPDFKQRYEAAQNIQRLAADGFDAAHPKESLAWKLGGGVLGSLGGLKVLGAATNAVGPEASLLVRAGTGGVEGAGVGAAQGYGQGNGDWADPSRQQGAMLGGLFGAGAGAALPIVAGAAGTAWRATGGRLVDALRGERVVQAPDEAAAQRLSQALRQQDPAAAVPPTPSTPGPTTAPAVIGSMPRQEAEAALVTAQRSPLTARASNVDDAYVRIARALGRQKMTPGDMTARVQEIGPFGAIADTGESTRDLLRAAINRPGRGATIAQENLSPRQAGVFDPESGQWTIRPSSTRITDEAQAGLGLEGKDFHGEMDALLAKRKADAGPAYAKAYQAPPVATSELADFAPAPEFSKAYGRARAISQKEFVAQPDGSQKIVPLPEKMPGQLDWRTLDLMKQGLDDLVKEGRVQGIGANEQGAIKGYLGRFVSKLDSLNPNYKAARDAFAGPTAMRDALDEGRGLLSEDAPQVAANLSEKSDAEKQMMRLGALQALQTKLGNANVTFDAANQAGLLKPNQLARFKALFPDSKSFSDFYRTMQNEKTMFGTHQAAFGNSTTAKQLLNVMEPADPQVEGVTQIVPAAATGNIVGLVKALHRMGMESPMREGVAETISSVLSSHDAGQLPEVARRIAEAQRRSEIADLIRQSMGTGAGQAAGRYAAPGH